MDKDRINRMRLCTVGGCANKHYGLNYCRLHWGRFKKHGNPLSVRIPLSRIMLRSDNLSSANLSESIQVNIASLFRGLVKP